MTDYNKIEAIKQIITELLQNMGLNSAKVEFEESVTRGLVFNISMPDPFLLIGRQGTTLHHLEILAQSMAAKKFAPDAPLWFRIDVDDYRIKREWFLKETAKEAAAHIQKTGRAVRLEPMPNYERRFVHAYLQEHYPNLFTESQGEEPYRQIIIRPKK